MQTQAGTSRELLTQRVADAMRAGATSAEILELVIGDGWQPGPERDPESDYVDGVLDSGRHVLIEIRRSGRRAR